MHRVGRTGRAGASGTAISFCDAEEKEYLRDIEKLIGKKIPVADNHAFPLIDHNPVKQEKQQRPPRSTHSNRPNERNSKPKSSHPAERSHAVQHTVKSPVPHQSSTSNSDSGVREEKKKRNWFKKR